MKIKLAAYATAAVVIGFAVIMLPLALKTGPPTFKPELVNPFTYTSSRNEGASEQGNQPANMDGFSSQPSYNMPPSGLVLLAGLAVALVAYVSIKKRLK